MGINFIFAFRLVEARQRSETRFFFTAKAETMGPIHKGVHKREPNVQAFRTEPKDRWNLKNVATGLSLPKLGL